MANQIYNYSQMTIVEIDDAFKFLSYSSSD